jgi:hypothetical protein
MPDETSNFEPARFSVGNGSEVCTLLQVGVESLLVRGEPGVELELRYTDLDGVVVAGGQVTVFAAGRSWRLRATGSVDPAAILERACRVPELTRSLRHLGWPLQGAAGEAEGLLQFLIDARRALNSQRDPLAQVRSFDGAQLASQIRARALDFAQRSFPAALPEQRAVEWQLLELLDPLLSGLEAVSQAAAAVQDAPASRLLAQWRSWLVHVKAVFAAADRIWPDLVAFLASVSRGALHIKGSSGRGSR